MIVAMGADGRRHDYAPLSTLRSGKDDFLDACAALWTAERIYRGTAKRIPSDGEQEHGKRGLDIAIWFKARQFAPESALRSTIGR